MANSFHLNYFFKAILGIESWIYFRVFFHPSNSLRKFPQLLIAPFSPVFLTVCSEHRKMNSLIVVTAFCSALAIGHAQTATTFGSRDISNLLRDNSVVQRQINCVLDRSPCDELGTMLKCKFILQLLNSCLVYLTISSPVVSIICQPADIQYECVAIEGGS
jgi:hypothetical protein